METKVLIDREWLRKVSDLDDERKLSIWAVCLGIAFHDPNHQKVDGFQDPVLDEIFNKTVIRNATAKRPVIIELKEK